MDRREAVKAMGAAGLATFAPHVSSAEDRSGGRPSAPDQPNILFNANQGLSRIGVCRL
jgi:hypothetical protein